MPAEAPEVAGGCTVQGAWGGGGGPVQPREQGGSGDPSLGGMGRTGPDPSQKDTAGGDRDRVKSESSPPGSGDASSAGGRGPAARCRYLPTIST